MTKVLSIAQPFAQCICLGIKKIETRSWQTHHRGLLLIHATQKMDFTALDWFHYKPLSVHREAIVKNNIEVSAIIGSVKLVDIKPVPMLRASLTPVEKALGYYIDTNFGWILEEPVLFDQPIPIRGQQGLWNFEMKEVQHG